MSASAGLATGSNPAWSLTFWNKVHRYRGLVLRYWWVVLLTLSIALCAAAYYQMNRPPAFFSAAKLSVNLDNHPVVAGDQGASNYAVDLETMVNLQIDIIKSSSAVRQNATDILQAKYPGLRPAPVSLDFLPRNSILNITATGPNAEYTTQYLQATIEGYLNYRKEQRDKFNNKDFDNLRAVIQRVEEDLKRDSDAIYQFQRDNNVYTKGDDGETVLAALRKLRETTQGEYEQLKLMTPEQGMEQRQSVPAAARNNGGNGTGAEVSTTAQLALELGNTQADYLTARAQLAELEAQLDMFSHDMRDKHPKIIGLKNQIETQKRRINDALEFARKRIESQRNFKETQLKELAEKIKAAEPAALADSVQRAKLDQLREVKARDEKTHDTLLASLSTASMQNKTSQESIFIMEPASVAQSVTAPWFKAVVMALIAGLGVGGGILFLLDRMDDRMGTISDFQSHFSEHVLGQIPRDDSGDTLELLRPDDGRHQLVESFRNLRSTLLFMPLDGHRPKTLLVTSAVPNEGKSTLSSNLALVLAFAGMKTLLIDADLRRGAIHQSFGVPRDPGLTDVLGHNVNWKLAIRTTGIENLHVLPRGRNVPQPSEYLLNKSTDRLLQELYPLYDYIVIDSSPILAADDTASLAPKIDATLFVTRMGFTSAKMTRKSLEILYKRQANIAGVILNQVDTSSPEFVYYQYEEYYSPATDEDEEAAPAAKRRKDKPAAKVS